MRPLSAVKRAVRRSLEVGGFELRRISEPSVGRATRRGLLQHVKRLGLAPATVIDVGVADGTRALYDTFPAAHLLLIEPLRVP